MGNGRTSAFAQLSNPERRGFMQREATRRGVSRADLAGELSEREWADAYRNEPAGPAGRPAPRAGRGR